MTSELNGTFHARSHECSPYRKVTVDLVQIVVLGAAKLLVHVVEDFFHKRTILTRNMKIAENGQNLSILQHAFGLATGLSVLGFVTVSVGHTSELDALLAFEFTVTGLSVLVEPNVEQLALGIDWEPKRPNFAPAAIFATTRSSSSPGRFVVHPAASTWQESRQSVLR